MRRALTPSLGVLQTCKFANLTHLQLIHYSTLAVYLPQLEIQSLLPDCCLGFIGSYVQASLKIVSALCVQDYYYHLLPEICLPFLSTNFSPAPLPSHDSPASALPFPPRHSSKSAFGSVL
ncbi:hypothetical protein PAMP_004048 [Pampus punctatissimus]